MKSILIAFALIAVVALSSCTTSNYSARHSTTRYGYGKGHVENRRVYSNGHGNVYNRNAHGRSSNGHRR